MTRAHDYPLVAPAASGHPLRGGAGGTRTTAPKAADRRLDQRTGCRRGRRTEGVIGTCLKMLDGFRPARPDRHRSLHEHPSDRLVRDAQVLSHVVQRPTLSVQADRLVNLRLGHHRPRLARTGDMLWIFASFGLTVLGFLAVSWHSDGVVHTVYRPDYRRVITLPYAALRTGSGRHTGRTLGFRGRRPRRSVLRPGLP